MEMYIPGVRQFVAKHQKSRSHGSWDMFEEFRGF